MISAMCQVHTKRGGESGGGNLVEKSSQKKGKKQREKEGKKGRKEEEERERERGKARKIDSFVP